MIDPSSQTKYRDLYTHSGSDVKKQFQTNFFGPISLIQAILPSFRAQKSGHIINMSSIAGFAGHPAMGAYNASKAALDGICDTLLPLT